MDAGSHRGRRRRSATAPVLGAVTASVASNDTVIAVPIAIASTDSDAAGPKPVEQGEAQHDQRAGAGPRPTAATADQAVRQSKCSPPRSAWVGRMRMAASVADHHRAA